LKKRRFIQNALLLTGATLLLRLAATLFQVYLSNRIGAEGIGLYQLVSSVYALAVTLSTSGISLAVTRIVSEQIALGNRAAARCAFKRSMFAALFLGLLAGGLLLFGAQWLGGTVLGDRRTILSLRLLSGGLPFLSTASVLRGYFLGLKKPIKSVSGDVVEMLATIGVTVPALNLLLPKGLEYACCALVAGSVLAEAISCLYSAALYFSERIPKGGVCERGMTRRILAIASPIALSNYFRSMLTTLENILVPPSLRRFGADTGQALSQYGMIKGMVMPVLLLPAAIMSAFASLLVPEVAGTRATGDQKRIDFIVERCFKATLLFAFLACGIFFCYAKEVGEALYNSSQVGSMLLILTPLLPLMYLDQIVDSILKGLNQQVYSMKVNTADSFIRVTLISLLVPLWGIRGYLVMFFAGTIFNASLSIGRLIAVSKVRFQIVDWVVKPIASSAFACLFAKCFLHCPTAPQLLLAAGTYLLALRVCGCITRRDIRWVMGIFKRTDGARS